MVEYRKARGKRLSSTVRSVDRVNRGGKLQNFKISKFPISIQYFRLLLLRWLPSGQLCVRLMIDDCSTNCCCTTPPAQPLPTATHRPVQQCPLQRYSVADDFCLIPQHITEHNISGAVGRRGFRTVFSGTHGPNHPWKFKAKPAEL